MLWRSIIEAFEAGNPDIRVRQEYAPGWYGQYEVKIRQQVLAGTLPHVVLMQLGPFTRTARQFAALDALAAGDADDPHPLSDLDATGTAAFTVNDDQGRQRLHGLPVAGGTLMIYCNPDCFAAASAFHGRDVDLPPDDWTLADFADLAQDLTCDFDGDGQLDQFGFWLPRWLYYLPLLWSYGARMIDPADGRWDLRGPAAEDAIAFYRLLARDRRVCPTPAEVPQLIQDVGFLTGKVAMCVNGPWFEPFLAQTRLADSYHVAPIPIGPAGRATRVTWDGLCIAANLPEPSQEAAWRFVRFCIGKQAQEMIARTGRSIPALRDALPAYDRQGSDPRRRKFVEALSYARLQPQTPYFAEVDRVIQWHLDRFVADESPHSAAEWLAQLAADPVITRLGGPSSSANR